MSPFAWLVIIGLILINALYVAAEFAAVAVRRERVRRLAGEGSRLAAGLLPTLDDPSRLDRYIAGCQIGITLSSLVLGAFGQATLTRDVSAWIERLGLEPAAALTTAATAVLVLLTILQVLLGELVPKSLALQFPTRAALFTYLPMVWSLAIYRWFIVVLNGSGLFLVKLLGFSPGSHRHVHSPEEIDMLIVESADGGLLEPEERKRLHDALRLGGRTARELMTPRAQVEMIDADAGDAAMFAAVMNSRHTRLPVYRGSMDRVIGFIHTRDLVAGIARGQAPALATVLRPVTTVPDSTEIARLLPVLRRRGQRLAVVIDEFGGVAGIVTLQDVLDELLGQAPGEEQHPGQPSPERLPDGRLRLPGLLPLTDASRLLDVDWRAPHVTTVGGLILSRLAHLPRPGERVGIDGVMLEVERVDRQMIASVLATPRAEASGENRGAETET